MASLMLRDPREGDRRQKRTLQQILQQLAQRRQAVAGRTGPGRKALAAGARGARALGRGRPFGGASFLQPLGLGSSPLARGQANIPGLQRVIRNPNPSIPLTSSIFTPDIRAEVGGELAPLTLGGDGYVPPASSFGFDPFSPGDPGLITGSLSGPGGFTELPTWGTGPVLQQGPGGPITVGGMIPLGGGRYLDPETLVIRGGGS